MDNELVLRDTLLYVSVILIAFGVGILQTNFVQGLISLAVAVAIFVLRGYLKKKGYLEKAKTKEINVS